MRKQKNIKKNLDISKYFINFAKRNFKHKRNMAKFKSYLKSSSSNKKDYFGGISDSLDEAIEVCANKIDDLGYSRETDEAREALAQRGYYCCGYSSYELGIEEV